MLFLAYLEIHLDWKTNLSYQLTVFKVPSWIFWRYWLVYYLDHLLVPLCTPVLLEKKLVYCCQDQNQKDEFFCFDNVSVYFFTNTSKKVIRWFEICLALAINWLSIRRLEIDSSDSSCVLSPLRAVILVSVASSCIIYLLLLNPKTLPLGQRWFITTELLKTFE